MGNEITRHQQVQELQGKVQEVFRVAFQNQYTAEKTIQVLQTMFSSIEEEELDRQFWEKYNSGVVHTATCCYEHDGE